MVTGLRCRAFAPAAQSPPTDLAAMPTCPFILIGGVALPFVLDNASISQFGLNRPIPARLVGGILRPATSKVLAAVRTLRRAAWPATCEQQGAEHGSGGEHDVIY
jgi:hypothetical protein